jgi:hypothetical protein
MAKEFKTSLGEAKVFVDEIMGRVVVVIKDKTSYNGRVFRGIAKCNFDEGDVFDADFGERLALAKALNKGFFVIANEREAQIDWLYETIASFEVRVAKKEASAIRAGEQCNKYAEEIVNLLAECAHKE